MVILNAGIGVVRDSVPVVTFRTREPTTLIGSMLMIAERSVGEFTVADATLMPAPKLTVVTP